MTKKNKKLESKVIIGNSGTGKTTLAMNYILENAKDYSLIIFLNTQHEEFIDDLSPYHASSVEEFMRHVNKNRRIIIYNIPITEEEIDDEIFFSELCRTIWYLKRLNRDKKFLFVIDEAHMFATTNKLPYYYKQFVLKGRSYNLVLMSITQRVQDLNNAVLTQTAEKWVFNLDNYDYKFMLKYYDYNNPNGHDYVIIK